MLTKATAFVLFLAVPAALGLDNGFGRTPVSGKMRTLHLTLTDRDPRFLASAPTMT